MPITDRFNLGTAEVAMQKPESLSLRDMMRHPTGWNSITLFVVKKGDMFANGMIGSVQKTASKAAESIHGVDSCVVHMGKITLYTRHNLKYAEGVEVATDFVNAFNELRNQLIAAADKALSRQP